MYLQLPESSAQTPKDVDELIMLCLYHILHALVLYQTGKCSKAGDRPDTDYMVFRLHESQGLIALRLSAPLGEDLPEQEAGSSGSPQLHLTVLPCTCKSDASEKKRKDYTFRRRFNEKPSIVPGCPGNASDKRNDKNSNADDNNSDSMNNNDDEDPHIWVSCLQHMPSLG